MSQDDATRSMADRTLPRHEPADAVPDFVGRYRVERPLGQGGFGRVYLAHDDLLGRPVAVKVPHADLVANPDGAAAYLAEARDVATLDHPGIVPVYDVGSTDAVPCYIVSKFIDGTDLAARMRQGRVPLAEAVELVAAVADAVHAAHRCGLVHRDIKPGNILLDRAGRAFVADFGVALRESDVGTGPRYAGTPPYMSPEQARGEGHRVDGRSDVFSLGVVLYELLTAARPFHAPTSAALLDAIVRADPRPPRQVNGAVPPHLERVCLKALAKRPADRYPTARAMAEDLRAAIQDPAAAPAARAEPPAAVVPKGLRSFDAADADFFLDLLPGPRDRHGLPEAVRFWKARVEGTDAEAFAVGLLYGPSGCGKSSLVKAGLLPRLAPHVTPIYLEATADLDARLLRQVVRACPRLAPVTSLPRALAAVRRGEAGRVSGKILIVLDQFEQWLHAHPDGADTELVRALRQCDGDRLQCLVLVRDDFWMLAARFMQALEVPVVEGENAAAVDLFPAAHARAVLTAFGRAFGTLPAGDLAPAQAAFLDTAVGELARDGWAVPVRLALFADLVKRRPWAGDVLKELGGAVGLGVTFLDETFASPAAPPEHRLHLPAVRAVLADLLPASGTNIRGAAKSRFELMTAADYLLAPAAFDDLMRVLIRETRLLTPAAADEAAANPLDQRYQLTHDYLVPSIREWLARQQQGTRRGRAELRLAERAALWSAKPEARQLPSFVEWLAIRLRTHPTRWTPSQRRMMRVATRRHFLGVSRLAVAAGVVALATLFVLGRVADERSAVRAEETIRRLMDANLAAAPAVVAELRPLHRWAGPRLERIAADEAARPADRLRARLALLPADPAHVGEVRDALLRPDTDPAEFAALRDAIAPRAAAVVDGLWAEFEAAADPRRRFHAAAALAAYDADNPKWPAAAAWVAGQLAGRPPLELPRWVAAFRPVREALTPPLLALLSGPAGGLAADVLGDYAADRPDVLADALAAAPVGSFPALFARLQAHGPKAAAALRAVTHPDLAGEFLTADAAGRRANVALALARLGDPEQLWPLLKPSPDPLVRTVLIDRFAAAEFDLAALLARLEQEPDAGVRAALWLALGGYDDQALPAAKRTAVAPRLLAAHRDDASAAVHSATGWLLNRWAVAPPPLPPVGDKQWRVTKTGLTMVTISAPVTFLMGNPVDSPDRRDDDKPRAIKLDSPYEIASTEVTVGLFQQFLQDEYGEAKANHPAWLQASADRPVFHVTWYEATHFCNWLSRREGIPQEQWCYQPNVKGEYANGMKIVTKFRQLEGYRLPTECEWEYACRGGAATHRSYGQAIELLARHAWHANNSKDGVEPVGQLWPNAFGLFDMHGNINEWCQNKALHPGDPALNSDAGETVSADDYRSVRGGNFFTLAKTISSYRRSSDRPALINGGGFRVARGRR